MLESSNVGDSHAARHDEVRSVGANENCTGDQVEQSELSLDSLGEDNGEDDGDLRDTRLFSPIRETSVQGDVR